MANSPDDLRDPKVSNTAKASNGMMKWIAIAAGAILALLLLLFLLGAFSDDEEATEVEGDADAVVITD